MSLIGAALIASGAGLIGSAIGASSQSSANRQNMEMFNRQMDYTEQTQREAWRRDDTSLQRSVADAQAAGLSPLAALNAGGSNASVVSAPHAPNIQPIYDGMFASEAGGNIVDAMIADKKLQLEEESLNIAKTKNLNDYELRSAEIKQQATLAADAIKATNVNLKMQIASTEDIAEKKLLQDAYQFTTNIERLNRITDFDQRMEEQKYLIDEIDSMMKEARGKTGDISSNFKVYDDYNKYVNAFTSWTNRNKDRIDIALASPSSASSARSTSAGGSAGVNLGLGGNESSYKGGSYGTSQSAGANMSLNGSSSVFNSTDFSIRDKAILANLLNEDPVPIYRPSGRYSY